MNSLAEAAAAAAAAAIRKRDAPSAAISASASAASEPGRPRKVRKADLSKEERLLYNRQAAAEGRKRKREMVEDLQRSVTFFTKSNASLKSRNAELERLILVAKQKIACGDTKGVASTAAAAAGGNSVIFKSANEEDEEEAMAARFSATQAMVRLCFSQHPSWLRYS